ncbi:MAG: hypothetical protein Q8R76_05765 [Candidatus Omnitrophota bacterium]|nr:hypothetical protein [Candidatus Omnitrophota bacterium]
MKRLLILVFGLMLVLSAPVFAGTIEDNAASADYVIKAPAMVLRGLANIALSPVEVVHHTYKGTMDGAPLVGTLEGAGTGIVWGLDRAGRGIWDVLTALFPNYNGAPTTHELEI